MNHGRAAARRRHAMRSITHWQEQFRSLAIEMQDLAVQIDGTDEQAADWIFSACTNLLGITHGLDKARDAIRYTRSIHQ